MGAEAIYFEGNPKAVNHTELKPKDGEKNNVESSVQYLNEIVTVNALKQMGSAPRFDFRSWLSFLAPLKDPVNLMYILFIAVIVYGVLAGALGWV